MPSKPGYRSSTTSVTEEDTAAFLYDLKDNDMDCPFRWLFSPKTMEFSDPVAPPFIEDTLSIFASNRNVQELKKPKSKGNGLQTKPWINGRVTSQVGIHG